MKKIAITLLISSIALMAVDGAALYKKCQSCHGVNGERKALNKSKVITGWDAAKTEAALKGYKAGTYGGPMKGLMKGQIASYNDAKIAAISAYIATLK